MAQWWASFYWRIIWWFFEEPSTSSSLERAIKSLTMRRKRPRVNRSRWIHQRSSAKKTTRRQISTRNDGFLMAGRSHDGSIMAEEATSVTFGEPARIWLSVWNVSNFWHIHIGILYVPKIKKWRNLHVLHVKTNHQWVIFGSIFQNCVSDGGPKAGEKFRYWKKSEKLA